MRNQFGLIGSYNVTLFSTQASVQMCLSTSCPNESKQSPPLLEDISWGFGVSDPSTSWIFEGSTFSPDSVPYGVISQYYSNVTANYMQVMLAATRFDLGNIYPNNIFYNASIVDNTLYSTQSVPGSPYGVPLGVPLIFKTRTNPGSSDPSLDYTGLTEYWQTNRPIASTTVSVPFLCHFTEAKSAGNAFISILVAITSLMGTTWVIMTFVMGWITTHKTPEGKSP